jgi:hypothetical protein
MEESLSSNENPAVVKRALTVAEMQALLTAVSNATSTAAQLTVAVVDLFTILLADEGKTLTEFDPEHRLDPSRYAIPTLQWTALSAAIVDRAAQWGTGAELALQLVNTMPASYDDPTAPVPVVPRVDYRPQVHTLQVSREAIDAIAAADAHIHALATHYGRDSDTYLDALDSWHRHLSHLFALGFGAHTRISRDGDLSLFVRTACGLVYAVIFHGEDRRCTDPACRALIGDDGTTPAYSSTSTVLDHEHTPTYPLGAPRPGTWSSHS